MYAITEDAYVIDQGIKTEVTDNVQSNTDLQDMNEEEYLERMFFTKADSVTMKKFLHQEGSQSQRLQCESCRHKHCEECHVMNDMNSVYDIELYKKLWDGVKVVTVNGKKRDDINVTFAPENSNILNAVGGTKRLITQLKKKGPQALNDLQEQIDKKIELGNPEKMSDARHEEVKKSPHHYCYPASVISKNK